jgi:histidine triad (HIT) family protein
MAKDDCIFCKIAAGKIPAKLCFENERVVAFDDINPQAPVHKLIIPREHIERLSDIDRKSAELVSEMLLAANSIAVKSGIQESGYRIVLNCNKDAGQEVFHIHMHLLGGRRFSWPPG